jgi:hypothetical protein
MKRICFGAAAAVFIAASAAPRAQEPRTEVPSAPTAGWTFVPGITVGTMYDSNVLVTTSIVQETGKPPTDTVFTLDPTGSLRYHGKRTQFGASYHGQFRQYKNVDALDRFVQSANASIERRATKRLTLAGQNSYEVAPTTDDVNLAGVPFTRAGVKIDRLSGTAGIRLTEFTDAAIRYNFSSAQFERQAPELTSGIVHEVSVSSTRRLTEHLRAGGESSFRIANMDVAGGRQLRFLEFGGIVNYRLGEFTEASFSGGLARLSDDLRDITRSGPYVRASISHLTGRALLGAGYERSFVPSFGFGGSTLSQQVRGWVDFPPIGRRLYTQASGWWRQTDPLVPLDVKRDNYQIRATAGYAIARTIRAQGFYAFSGYTAVRTGIQVDRNRIGAELVLFQPMRIR